MLKNVGRSLITICKITQFIWGYNVYFKITPKVIKNNLNQIMLKIKYIKRQLSNLNARIY